MHLRTTDIHDIRRKANNWLHQRANMGYKVESLIEQSKRMESIQDLLDILYSLYIKTIDVYFALANMDILGVDAEDVEAFSEENEDAGTRDLLRRELNALWAQHVHKFDDDETEVLRI